MKKIIIMSAVCFAVAACGSGGQEGSTSTAAENSSTEQKSQDPASYDPHRGEGKFSSVELGPTVDLTMAKTGEDAYGVKCSSCHKLSDERLVGPGWAGVTSRRKPEWIMNFITNPDPMIDKDPEVQAQLEICLVRMPNQNLADDEARAILEFMRKNDGVK